LEIPSFDLTGRTAIVTGASRGLGKGIARALAAAGADVVLAARTVPELEETAAHVREYGRRALVVPTDVSRADQVNAMVDQAVDAFGKVDVLVNNSGVYHPKPVLEMADEDWELVIGTNLSSQFYCARAVGRHMVARRYGKIVNIASTWSFIGVANNVAYCAAKGGVAQLTKSLAIEWARYGVRVNAIAPGHIRTTLSTIELENPKIRDVILSHIPLKYVSEPEDIAPLAVYLASSASDFMTGSILLIDGGQTAE
jgi:NAD(P)-dependent dehydrogenase (short-subunit alcohol dehydrogenase family)